MRGCAWVRVRVRVRVRVARLAVCNYGQMQDLSYAIHLKTTC